MIKIGSRESKLAVLQAEIVMRAIRRNNPGVQTQLITMKTTGDMILDRTLDQIGGKGLFVKELDRALLDGKVDMTVHSFKDMPMETDERLPVVAASPREDPRDALILPRGTDALDPAKPIGCASARRTLQLKRLFPGHAVLPVRGNVQTRLQKLDSGEYSALVLACAGLKRLGLEHRISRIFEPWEILPAACQGILAVQARADFDTHILDGFHDPQAMLVAKAERSFVRALDGGCSSPVAAYAVIEGDCMTLTGLYADGNAIVDIQKTSGNKQDGEALGKSLALRMIGEAK